VIVVTGASGGLGRLVLDRLTGEGPVVGGAVVAGGRSPDRLPGGLHPRPLDFDDPAGLPAAFSDADVVLLISAGQGEDDAVIARHAAAIDAAEAAGVRHIVYTSLTGAGDHLALAISHRWTERRLMTGRADWTILRNGLYAELAIPGTAEAAVTGEYTAPMGEGRWAAVAREDLAAVAANVVSDAACHRGKVYELVGDRAVSGRDIADTVAEATGGSVSYLPDTLGQLRFALTTAGMPEWQVPTVISSYSAIGAGFLDGTGGDLTALLGGPPRSALDVIATALMDDPR